MPGQSPLPLKSQNQQTNISNDAGDRNDNNSRSHSFRIRADGNNRHTSRLDTSRDNWNIDKKHHRNRQSQANYQGKSSSSSSSRSKTFNGGDSIGGRLFHGVHSRSFSPPQIPGINIEMVSAYDSIQIKAKNSASSQKMNIEKQQALLPHSMDHASDSSSGYIRNMGYLHINSEHGTSPNNDTIVNDGHSQLGEDCSGTVSILRKNMNQKPPAYTASSAASIESLPEKDGYSSSGAMSDGNVSRRSVFSGESDQGMASDRGSIESNRFAHHASYYQISESCKSDIATICSNSMVDDMDVASILSGDANQISANASVYTPATIGYIPRSGSFSGKKSNLSRSFTSERSADYPSSGSRHVSMQEPPMVLNDMGPPVSRIIIQQRHELRAGSIGGHSSASGGIASDVAHLDTDDGASITAEMDNHSIYSNIHRDDGHALSEHEQTTVACADEDGDEEKKCEVERLQPIFDSAPQTGSGRRSPGGTVYKGRGVRRYQGRYMNLPLKRFQQNSRVEEEESSLLCHSHHEDERKSSDFWDRNHSRSRSRSGEYCRSNRSFRRSQSYNRLSRSFTRKDETRKSHSRSRSRRNR